MSRSPGCLCVALMNRNSSFNRTPDQVFGSRVCHVRGLPSSRTRWMRWMTQDTPRLDGYAHTAPAPARPRPAGRRSVDAADGRQTVLGGGGPRASAASVRPQHALTLKPLALPGLSRPGHNTHRSARARRRTFKLQPFLYHTLSFAVMRIARSCPFLFIQDAVAAGLRVWRMSPPNTQHADPSASQASLKC